MYFPYLQSTLMEIGLQQQFERRTHWSKAYRLAFKYTKRGTRGMEFKFKFPPRWIANNEFLTKNRLETTLVAHSVEINKKKKKWPALLFWFDPTHSFFWSSYILRLITVVLGLRPDSSKSQHSINFNCVLARYYFWICLTEKTKSLGPKLEVEKGLPHVLFWGVGGVGGGGGGTDLV